MGKYIEESLVNLLNFDDYVYIFLEKNIVRFNILSGAKNLPL